MSIRDDINAAIKAAMIAKEKRQLQTLRGLNAAFKQIEIDRQIEVTDEVAIRELVRQVKQRQESAKLYRQADRQALADTEEAEIAIIQQFLPQAMSDQAMKAHVDQVVASEGLPKTMQSMGPLMGRLKAELEGKADMAQVSAYLRHILSA